MLIKARTDTVHIKSGTNNIKERSHFSSSMLEEDA